MLRHLHMMPRYIHTYIHMMSSIHTYMHTYKSTLCACPYTYANCTDSVMYRMLTHTLPLSGKGVRLDYKDVCAHDAPTLCACPYTYANCTHSIFGHLMYRILTHVCSVWEGSMTSPSRSHLAQTREGPHLPAQLQQRLELQLPRPLQHLLQLH
jgi:hypothetical protein